jgi:hypothetical protein
MQRGTFLKPKRFPLGPRFKLYFLCEYSESFCLLSLRKIRSFDLIAA